MTKKPGAKKASGFCIGYKKESITHDPLSLYHFSLTAFTGR
jgi:hypothetical protein